MPRNLAKPTKAERLKSLARTTLYVQIENLLPSDRLAHVTMKVPQVLEGNLSGPLRPYRVLFGYSNLEETPEHCQWAALCLYPGITEREAIEAVKLLIKKLPKSPGTKGGRPTASRARIAWIHQAFERCTNGGGQYATGDQWITHYLKRAYDRQLSLWERLPHAQKIDPKLPRPKLEVLKPRTPRKGAIIERAIAGTYTTPLNFVKQKYKLTMDLTFIKKQHSLWKAVRGQKPKRYLTKKQDTRD